LIGASLFLAVWLVGLAWWVGYQDYRPCGLTDTAEQARQLAEDTGCDDEAPWP